MRTIQISVEDQVVAHALQDAVLRSGPWQVETPVTPDLARDSVVVVDPAGLSRLPLPLEGAERIVLIAPKEADLGYAWDAGLVSVVSTADAVPTVLLAIMAAALRAESFARHRAGKRDISHSAEEKLRH
jgi:hypothetical protein